MVAVFGIGGSSTTETGLTTPEPLYKVIKGGAAM